MIPPRLLPLAVGLAALVAWAVAAVLAPAAAFRGWLVGFVFTSGLSLGPLALMLIHRLAGGRWGEAFRSELEPAARITPLLGLYVLPVLAALPLIYPWAADPGALRPGVHGYLNPTFFIVRTAAALVGAGAIAVVLPRIEGPRGRLAAALGLAFYGAVICPLSVDWVLSVEPGWTSSDFPMVFATEQLATGFAWAALQARRRADDPASGDLCGFLFAMIIGLTYLAFMAFLVVWYGDKPGLDAWYLARERWPWRTLPLASLALGLVAVVLLAARRGFGTHKAAALAGACVLAALISYQLWLLAPALGAACLVPAAFALVAQVGVWIALTGGLPRLMGQPPALAPAAQP